MKDGLHPFEKAALDADLEFVSDYFPCQAVAMPFKTNHPETN
jgi:hypothetical protein